MTDNHLDALAAEIQAATSPFRNYLVDLHHRYLPCTEGHWVTDLEPGLTHDQNWLGICAVTVDGQVLEVGNANRTFVLQALSGALIYGLALEDWGRDYVSQRINVKPVGEALNSLTLDESGQRAANPLTPTGAMLTTSLIQGQTLAQRFQRVLDLMGCYTGRSLSVNESAHASTNKAGHRERAIAHFLFRLNLLHSPIDDTVDLYFLHRSLLVSSRDLAMISATLANGGINPVTGKQALAAEFVPDVISVLLTCGMYERSGEWTRRIGMPIQTSTSGGVMAIVPQKLGLGIFSPYLNESGNSIRGLQICETLSKDYRMHLFDIYERNQQMQLYIDQVNKLTAAAADLEHDRYDPQSVDEVMQRSDELGQLAQVFQRMVAQVKVREQQLKRQIQELQVEIDKSAKEKQVADIVQSETFQNLKEKLERMKRKREERGLST